MGQTTSASLSPAVPLPGGMIRPHTRTSQLNFRQDWSPISASFRRLTGTIEPHAHDFLKIDVIAEGTGLHRTSGGDVAFVPGSVFVLRPGAWHWYVDCDDMLVGHCCVSASALRGEFAFIRSIPDVRRLLWTAPMRVGGHGVLATSVPPPVARTSFDLIMELQRALADGCRNRTLLAARLLTLLGTIAESSGLAPGTEDAPAAVTEAVSQLEAGPEEPWTLDHLARRVGLSPTYLSRLFREHVGLPPLAYLARLRAERAAVLLAQTDMGVAEVGMAVGWVDPNYFTRRFRALSGLSPRAYRQRARDGLGALAQELLGA